MTARMSAVSQPKARGMLFIHSAPAALCPHIEWAIGTIISAPVSLDWTDQPVERGARRAELSWTGPANAGAAIASKLASFGHMRFEVTEEASMGTDGQRFSYTPSLGAFNAITGVHGDILVHEDRIRSALSKGSECLQEELQGILGTPWDDELDVFRHASDDAPVRWLHQVV